MTALTAECLLAESRHEVVEVGELVDCRVHHQAQLLCDW